MMKTIAIPARLMRDDLTPEELVELSIYGDQPMTDDEIAERQNDEISYQAEKLIRDAKNALEISDMVALRCFKSGIQFPQEWENYVLSLRAIINGASGTISNQPNYPQGT